MPDGHPLAPAAPPLKVGVIGVGRLGRQHARWLRAISDTAAPAAPVVSCELVGVFDTNTDRSREVSAEFSCRAFGSLSEALGAVDAVSIVTSTTTHAEVTIAAINAGCHVLVEKPIASTVSDAMAMIVAAKAAKRALVVGHIERFNPAYLAIRDLGLKPRFIEAHRLAAFDPRGTDVAVILDLMIHDIDMALTLVGAAGASVDAAGASVGAPALEVHASAVPVLSEHADIANARLVFANGAVANLTASRISLKPMRKLRLFQESGYVALDFDAKHADVYTLIDAASPRDESGGMRVPFGKSGREILYRSIGGPGEDMLKLELEAFLAACRGKRAPAVTGEDGLAALKVALEVERVSTEARCAFAK